MVMGDNSCLRVHGFESQHGILDGHFFALLCCINCIVCLKRPKINEKEAGVGPLKISRVLHKIKTNLPCSKHNYRLFSIIFCAGRHAGWLAGLPPSRKPMFCILRVGY